MKTFLKRLISLALCLAALSFPSALAAEAEAPADTAKADVLNELGLFNGRGTAADGTPVYALEDTASRIEGLVMLVRLLGEESDALAYTGECPFTDVPAWAERYAAYAYSKGYVNGMTPTTYEPNRPITGHQYTTLILRALGYTETDGDFTYSEARAKAVEVGLLEDSGDYSDDFCRGDIVSLSHRALTTGTKEGRYLSSQLAEKIGTEQFAEILAKHDLAEPEPQPRTVREDYPNGNYTISVYSSDGKTKRVTWYDPNDVVMYFFIGELASNGTTIKSTYYTADGAEDYYILFEYDAQGRKVKTSYYNAAGLYQYDTMEYHADGTKTSRTYSADGTPKIEVEYYASGQRRQDKIFGANGKTSIAEFDEDGCMNSFTVFTANGTLHQKEIYDNDGNLVWYFLRLIDGETILIDEYADDRSHTASYYDLNNVLKETIEYDSNEIEVRATFYFENGKPEHILEYDETGTLRRSTHYDRNGNVLDVTDY